MKSRNNSQQNIGYSSKLNYDLCSYNQKIKNSTSHLNYIFDTNKLKNCNECLPSYGINTYNGGSGSIYSHVSSDSVLQDLVEIDSILKNRNFKKNKCSDVNPINVLNIETKKINICDKKINPKYTKLTPKQYYKETAINRFYDLDRNPQNNIFWNFEINSKLEAKDNYFNDDLPKLNKNNCFFK